jgi:hypothetical protein
LHFQCKPEDYQRKALLQCLYPQARIFWRLLDLTGGPAVLAAYTFIEMVGQTQSREDLLDVISEYRDDIKPHSGFLAQTFKVRVSIERLMALHNIIRKTTPNATSQWK